MNQRFAAGILVAGALLYIAAFGWSIVNLSYDMWGAFVVIPPLSVLGVLALRRMFPGDLQQIATILSFGLFVKFAGAAARYWVGFEAYDGGIDAQRYHDYAAERATSVWSGESSVWSLVPDGFGTPFMEDATAIIYAFTGASKLAGFFVFAWIAYMGTAWFVKAASIAIPGFLNRRYAVLCALAPSIVYWPSSIGKEAWMFLTLGLGTYGVARVLSRRGLAASVVIALVGLLAAAMVRPHMAGLWLAGVLPALVVLLFARDSGEQRRVRGGDRLAVAGAIVLAAVGLVIAAGATLRYLDFSDETGDVTAISIIEETSRRTQQAGSSFEPPSVSSPTEWPYASVRTLTRPLLIEARGAGQLLSALEVTALLGVALISWRRVANLPRLVAATPYLTFAMTVLFFGSLAFTSFANLGVLTRQRTLLFPFLLLVLCVPTRAERAARRTAEAESRAIEDEHRSLVEAERARLRPAPIEVPAGWHRSDSSSGSPWKPAVRRGGGVGRSRPDPDGIW
ncbi:MAG: hypothetical protein WD225_02445 [Ilumatobacteraceae bacterium]